MTQCRCIYIYLLLFSLMIRAYEANQILDNILQKDEALNEFVDVAIYMTKKFISPKTNTLVIMTKCEFICEEHKKYHSRLLHNIANNLNESLSIQLLFEEAEDRPWDYNIFLVDSWPAFQSLRFQIPFTTHERDYYFFIILTWDSDLILFKNLQQIFDLCLKFNVKNVVVMHKSKLHNFISFYTFQLYNWNFCAEHIMVREINRYENGRLDVENLFPEVLNNFYGCPLKISANLFKPFITFNGDLKNATHLRDMQRLSGIEGEILKFIAKALNFKIHMRFSNESNRIGNHFNSTGCFQDLEQRKAFIAIGGFSSTIKNNQLFTQSIAYHTTSYKFVVRSNVHFGPIRQLINPLDKMTWLLLLIYMSINIVSIQAINHFKMLTMRNFLFGTKNKRPTFNMIITFLGYSMPFQILPKRNFSRFLLISWLLLSFEIRNGYQGKMFDSLRLAKHRPVPRRIAELIDKDYILLSPSYTSFYPRNKTQIWSDSNSSIFKYLQTSRHPLLTGAFILDYWAYYKFKNPGAEFLIPVAESIQSYQFVMYFNKHSLLKESFDKKLNVLIQSGITSKIALKNFRPKSHIVKIQMKSVKTIELGSLIGLFRLYSILSQLALYVFILEMLTKKSKRLKAFFDWLN